ncbi:hypothetical protein DPMN_013384 [Dreissena polymorpha]|uniref:Uncharacterized protein n=1 Tax=Dreissena polymorpha TaxID=45954 RepID=A0A9D4N7V0_DREPO|nr:hypothetical protein DPMN_013384 [Dreissena polymorpha]
MGSSWTSPSSQHGRAEQSTPEKQRILTLVNQVTLYCNSSFNVCGRQISTTRHTARKIRCQLKKGERCVLWIQPCRTWMVTIRWDYFGEQTTLYYRINRRWRTHVLTN